MKKLQHLLTIQDLDAEQILDLFRQTKKLKKGRSGARPLVGKTLGLLFQKPSVRTRVSFEVGMAQLGGQSIYIGPIELQEGKRESAKDLAGVLSRYLDGIVVRTFSHNDVAQMARWSSVPIINGLSDASHPCQALSDLFTVQEHFGKLEGLTIAYVGDGNNVCHSLLLAATLLGVHVSVASPRGYEPDASIIRHARKQGKVSSSQVHVTNLPSVAVKNADVIYTDVWTSMGQEKEKAKRLKTFKPFQVNSALIKQASKQAVFMHCLPAHRGEEVTDQIIDSKRSIVYHQAENRLHVQKAILLTLLGSSHKK